MAAVLALLVLMVLIAPQAYQALVGSNSGTPASPPKAKDAENLGAEEPVAEPAPPAETSKEPAPEEPAVKGIAAKPSEDAAKAKEAAPEEEPVPAGPAAPEAEEAALAVLASDQQYSSVAQYNVEQAAVYTQYAAVEQAAVDTQYAVTEQYLLADQSLPVLPEPVVTEPVDLTLEEQKLAVDLPAVQTPVPAPIPVPAVPDVVEPVMSGSDALLAAPLVYEPEVPAAVPDASPTLAAPAAAPAVQEEALVAQVAPATGFVRSVTTGAGVAASEDQAGCGTGAAGSKAFASSKAVSKPGNAGTSKQNSSGVCGDGTASATARFSSGGDR